jgi:hypothetical protein
VHDRLAVHVLEALEQLGHDVLDLRGIESFQLLVGQDTRNIVIHVLEHQIAGPRFDKVFCIPMNKKRRRYMGGQKKVSKGTHGKEKKEKKKFIPVQTTSSSVAKLRCRSCRRILISRMAVIGNFVQSEWQKTV